MEVTQDRSPIAIRHEQAQHNDFLVINWCLGNTCNYACSYCPELLHDATVPWMPYETVAAFCDRVLTHYRAQGKRNIYFEFTGGEVSHHKDFIKILKFLKERDVWTGMISNGSKHMKWWEEAKPHLDHACISFHPESAKADHFKKVLRYLNDTVTLHVNVMMLPEKFNECLELARWVEAETENITIAIQPLLKDFSDVMYPYTPEQKASLENQVFNIKFTRPIKTYRGRMVKEFADGKKEIVTGPELIAKRENRWAGWECRAGLDELVVDFDGNIYRAWCMEDGRVGNVKMDKIEFPKAPVLCKRDFCHCVLDVMNERTAAHS
ncbi:MAG: radical SAM protein [Bdellovibrionia bacterium]